MFKKRDSSSNHSGKSSDVARERSTPTHSRKNSEVDTVSIHSRKEKEKEKDPGPMIGDPDYEKLVGKSFDQEKQGLANPVKWMHSRKEKKQQDSCRMEWQDFEIDRLKCECEILQIRDMKNIREKEELHQEIYDYKNCMAISYHRVFKLHKLMKQSYDALRQVHEWIPEDHKSHKSGNTGEDAEPSHMAGKDKEELASMVSDVEEVTKQMRLYIDELTNRTATKYFASKSAKSSSRHSSLERPSAADEHKEGNWNGATPQDKTTPASTTKPPWWKAMSIDLNKHQVISPVDSEVDIVVEKVGGPKCTSSTMAPPKGKKTGENKTSSLSVTSRGSRPIAEMLEFSNESIMLDKEAPKRKLSRGLSRGMSEQQDMSAQQIVHDMFDSSTYLPTSDSVDPTSTTTVAEKESKSNVKDDSRDSRDSADSRSQLSQSQMSHKSRALSRNTNKEHTKRATSLKSKTSANSQGSKPSRSVGSLSNHSRGGDGSCNVSRGSLTNLMDDDVLPGAGVHPPVHQANSDGEIQDPRTHHPLDSNVEEGSLHQAKSDRMVGQQNPRKGMLETLQEHTSPASSRTPSSIGSNRSTKDLFILLQQTEHEVHMLRSDREDLMLQLKEAQGLLDLLSMEIEQHKKEITRLKEKCRAAKDMLG